MNSKAKGCRGERMLAQVLTHAGFPAKRGQQFHGGAESPDVVCPTLDRWHWEAKFAEQLRFRDWLAQAEGDAAGKPWIIAWKRRFGPWLTIIKLEDLLDLIRDRLPPATAISTQPPASFDADNSAESQATATQTKEQNMKLDELYPSRWLKASDVTRPVLATIKTVAIAEVAEGEDKPTLHFLGELKPMVLNRTNSASIGELYGADTDLWTGKPLVLFSTKVQFQSKLVDAIRVRAPKPPVAPVAVVPAPPPVAVAPSPIDSDDVPF